MHHHYRRSIAKEMSLSNFPSARSGPTPIDRPVAARPIYLDRKRRRAELKHPRSQRPVAVPFVSDTESEDGTSRLPLPPSKRQRLNNAMQAWLQLNINEGYLESLDEATPNQDEMAAVSNQQGPAVLSGVSVPDLPAAHCIFRPMDENTGPADDESVVSYSDLTDRSLTLQYVASSTATSTPATPSSATLSSATLSSATPLSATLSPATLPATSSSTSATAACQLPYSSPRVLTEDNRLHAPEYYDENMSFVWKWLQNTDFNSEIEVNEEYGSDTESIYYDLLWMGVGRDSHTGPDHEAYDSEETLDADSDIDHAYPTPR
ncbi:hypothetical protein OPT61_g3082 [Boeremia exigua]|uniref:Uncharacterized protein n=1 Tax=Boeremia exigua TaxID=749465 RepID=A0ACC2IJ77_9PLEO|nr:hypothetical protein OPT61_g3082 [Boeremia exigua]